MPCTSGSSRVSLLSYNILNPFVVNIPGQEHTWFHRCPPELIDWERRKRELLSTILDAGADVVCLQEVFLDGDHKKADTWRLPEWMGALEDAGYNWVAKSLRPRKTSGTHDGNVVLFRRNRFELIFDEGVKRRAMVTGLRARDSGALFAVCNVHLEGSPDARDERSAQLQAVLDKVRQLQGAHVVVVGDFNSEMSEFTEFLGSSTPLRLFDAFPSADGPSFGAVTVGGHWPAAIDHVLLDASLRALVRRRVLDSEAEVEELRATGTPSAAHPSDHLPLALVFEPVGPSLIVPEAAELPGSGNKEPLLSTAEAAELQKRWEEVQASKPAAPERKGKPPGEYIQRAKDFRSREKAFLDALSASERQWLQQFGKCKGA